MSLPIDEMLTELREKLENFEEHTCYAMLDDIVRETNRIVSACEDELEDE